MRFELFLRRIAIYILLFSSSYIALGTSCLPGWKYQMEINVTNSGSSVLSNFQVMVEFNSAAFVSAGKMKISGSDIRFIDNNNNLLSHWIVPGTFNTSNTQIWINVTEIPVDASKIYMYYGNSSAFSTSNGEETFTFFDDFESGTANWDFCGGSHYTDNGQLILYSSDDNNYQALMKTTQVYSAPYISEMNVTNYSGNDTKRISILQMNSAGEGFGLTSIQTDVNDKMEITQYASGTDCFSSETSFGNANLSSGLLGIWQFVWKTPNSQCGIKGEGDVDLQGTDITYSYPATMKTGVAVYGTTASVTIDWFRIRKWANVTPIISLNTASEAELPDAGNVNASSNAPLCEGETLTLYADDIDNADYTWYKPDGTILTTNVIPSPIINASTANAGTYQLVVEPYSSGCTSITSDVIIEIFPATIAGIIDGETEVCSGDNNGYLELKNYTGEIIRWEYSLTGGDPWATIDNTSSRQDYQNLTQTTYYRAVVKSGECNQLKSGIAAITVSSPSNAGTANGNITICKNESANIQLYYYNGNIILWEESLNQSIWTDAGFSIDHFNTGNLDTTTYFRAIVNNGTCQSDTSNNIKIEVNCQSVGGAVEKDTVCTGSSGELELTGYTGSILRWEESLTGVKPWTTIQENGNKLIYENVTQTKYYRVVIQNLGCDTVYSETGGVIVDQHPLVNEIIGTTSVCSGLNNGEIILYDYTGVINNWQFSIDNGGSWQNSIINNDTIEYNNLTETTLFRANVQSNLNVCSAIYSNSVKITVNEPTVGGITGNSTIVCSSENQGTIKLTAYRGEIIRWEKSKTGKTPWDVLAISTDSLNYINQSESTYYRAVVQNDACEIAYSDSTLVKVDQVSNAGIITGATSHCAESNQGTLNLTNNIGTVTKWEKSTNQEIWQYQSYITPNKIEYSNLEDTTFYRVIVQNGVCSADTSDIASIKIYPLPIVDFIADTVELGQATHFNNLSSILSGSLSEYQWDFGNGASSSAKNPIEIYNEAKTYFVTLKVKSDKSCLDSIKKTVLIYPKPEVDYSFLNVCLGDTVFFVNNSTITEGSVTYEWDFGDGITSDLIDPYHKFISDGVFSVTLTATTDMGVQSFKTHNVEVYSRAHVDFELLDACENVSVSFINQSNISNGSINFYWNFGDGNTSISLNPNHSYENFGDYNVQLIAVSNYNCKDTLVKPIRIYPIPTADFQAADVPYQTAVSFIDNSSIESGAISSWNWSFGDGNFSNIQNPDYLYATPGNYLVNMTVKSDFGCSNSVSKNINVFPLPNASFIAGNVCFGTPVSFINQSTLSAGNLSYEWNFGDDESSIEINPSHNYEEPGIYLVTLIANSSSQGRDTIQKEIEVYPNPEPDFTVPDECDGNPSYFTNNSIIKTGTISLYNWDFGDGTNSVQNNPVKLYLNSGEYNVELSAKSEKGCESSIIKQAFVRKNPLADFSFSNECVGEEIKLSNHTKCDEGNVYYYWAFGDGSISILENPVHNYSGSGIYNIKLLARSSYQCVDSLARYATIYSLPQVDAGMDTSVSRGFTVTLQAAGATIFDWSPAESLDNPGVFNPVARPMETTTYSVRGIDMNDCENTDEVTVTVKDDYQVIANNVLTPDYNGLNDTWTITNIDAFETATVYIFNRWGEEIYSKKGYMNDWEGRNSNGDVLPDGTYFYVIQFPDNKKHYSGSITILRNQ